MRIELLGIHDSIAPGNSGMCLLLDGTIALDAGALTDSLSMERQQSVEHIILTHCHFDHIKSLPFFADGLAMTNGSHGERTAIIYSPDNVLAELRSHIFNNIIWPDFTAIPPKNPVLAYRETPPVLTLGAYEFRFIPVTHSVPTYAIYITATTGQQVLYVTDTGPTQRLWDYLSEHEHPVDAMFIDVAFPDRLKDLAVLSGHLTPSLLVEELKKTTHQPRLIYPIHMKSAFIADISAELSALFPPERLRIHKALDTVYFPPLL